MLSISKIVGISAKTQILYVYSALLPPKPKHKLHHNLCFLSISPWFFRYFNGFLNCPVVFWHICRISHRTLYSKGGNHYHSESLDVLRHLMLAGVLWVKTTEFGEYRNMKTCFELRLRVWFPFWKTVKVKTTKHTLHTCIFTFHLFSTVIRHFVTKIS